MQEDRAEGQPQVLVDWNSYQHAWSLGRLFKDNNRPYSLNELQGYDLGYLLVLK